MANKNFNTQIRKKFDKGSEKPSKPSDSSTGKGMKAKDMLDRNKKRLRDTMESLSPENKKRLRDTMERRRNLKRKERAGKAKQPKQPIEKPPLKKEPLRKTKLRELREDKKPRINKIKDKLKKVGNMKVKDAAKVVGKGILAGTPVGLAKNAADTFNKNFKLQSPIVRKNRKFGGR